MTFHIVRMDEKIEKIALNYQLEIEEIKNVNKYIRDWDHLIPGTKLKLPEISIALNQELDAYEPFIEEYYPKLSQNYNELNKNTISDDTINNQNTSDNTNNIVKQELILPKNNTYYPYQNYYLGYPYSNYYYQVNNRNKRKRKY